MTNPALTSALRRAGQKLNRSHSLRLFHGAPVSITNPSSQGSRYTTVLERIQQRVERNELTPDSAQNKASKRLTRLQNALRDYDNESTDSPEGNEKRNGTAIINEKIEPATAEGKDDQPPDDTELKILVPRGLYLHGGVGVGKSMLMDVFFSDAPLHKKRRVHFHSFMQEVHARIHRLKKSDIETNGRSFHIDTNLERNPIHRVAMDIADEVKLICFDEFQVTDVADALMLKQLFSVLFSRGTVMVATSNRPPSDLYEGGLNRSYFLPFIDLLHRHCIVHHMSSEVDYRRLLSEGTDEFFFVSDNDADSARATAKCDLIFEQLLNGKESEAVSLQVAFNRTITLDNADPSGTVCRVNFNDLCNKELGSSDYNAIGQHFQVVILEGIPKLTIKEHDQARRFITLIDELYEARCALVCSAADSPDCLFVHQINTEKKQSHSVEKKGEEMMSIDVAQTDDNLVGELASIRELHFAFRRASSRIVEMCSKTWWEERIVQ